MKKYVRVITLVLVLGLLLTACGGNKPAEGGNKEGESVERKSPESTIAFDAASLVVEHEGEAIEGGILQYGIVTDPPLKGLFDINLYEDSYDAYILQLMYGGNLYGYDESFKLVSSEYVDINYDFDNNTVTWKLNPELKWNDGTPVTSKDLEYPFYVVGHPDYTGVRYDDTEDGRIVGMNEYHAGETDTISGITLPDELTMVVQYDPLTPATQWGSGQRAALMPYHYLKDIPVADLEASDEIRIRPLSYGPFYIANQVQGEKYELRPNPYWFKGKPGLAGINVEVVPASNVVAAMKAHKYDMLSNIPSKSVDELREIPGYSMVGKGEFYYSYLGFALGTFEDEKVVVNPEAKMANVNLRKALGYALDQDAVGKKFYNGYNELAKSIILPVFPDYYDKDIEGYYYNPELANQLLDEAGFKDTNDDGFREDPKGNELVVRLAMMSGSDIQEPLSQYYIQQWAEIGIKAELTDGRLLEFNDFYDRVQAGDENIDVFAAAWGVGTNPNPKESYGDHAPFNMSRYTSETLQEPIDRISSMEASDPEFLAKAYKDFQKAAFEEVPAIPLQWRTENSIVNKRVLNVDVGYGNGVQTNNSGEWQVTAEEPLAE